MAKRLFDRYPNSQNLLAEPAIVLVNEIDLHLHFEWQKEKSTRLITKLTLLV